MKWYYILGLIVGGIVLFFIGLFSGVLMTVDFSGNETVSNNQVNDISAGQSQTEGVGNNTHQVTLKVDDSIDAKKGFLQKTMEAMKFSDSVTTNSPKHYNVGIYESMDMSEQ